MYIYMYLCIHNTLAPSAVINLMVEDINSTSLVASFSTPASPNGVILQYNIRYLPVLNGLPSGEEVTLVVLPNHAGVYTETLSDLLAFTMYRVRVAAVTSAGQGQEEERFASTDPAASSPPTNLSVVAIMSESVTLTWEYPETPRGSIQGYIIRYHPSSDLDSTLEENITLASENDNALQSYTIFNLTPFPSYTLTVRAYSFGSDPFVLHQGMETGSLHILTAESGILIESVAL